MDPSLSMPLSRDLASPGAARRALGGFAARNRVDDAVAVLVVSELVTNAVTHGTEPVTLSAGWDGRCILLQVSDGDPDVGAVRVQQSGPNTVGGRGLFLVEAMSVRWGVSEHRDGKSVWAEVAPGPAIR
jgi:anti-sigma regulatory factor (Ser/Thr protein kinase)